MDTNTKRPRDYDLAGFCYDARVVCASSWYLVAQHQAPLVLGEFGEDADRQIEAELAAYAEICDSRADGIHRPVSLEKVDRLVCTCGLVVRTLERFADPVGHLDVRCRMARALVVKLDDRDYFAACQSCGARTDDVGLVAATAWVSAHQCDETPNPGDADTAGEFTVTQAQPGEHFDDFVHRARSAKRSPRPSGM